MIQRERLVEHNPEEPGEGYKFKEALDQKKMGKSPQKASIRVQHGGNGTKYP